MPPIISRSFLQRRRDNARPGLMPLGQDVTRDFPVLPAAAADLALRGGLGLRPGVPT